MYVTFHILHTLGLHNLNRDQNGLPKSHRDGGIDRARLSSQSLKNAARTAYRDSAHGADTGVRTRVAPDLVVREALDYASESGAKVDEKKLVDAIGRVIKSLTNAPDKDEKKVTEAAKNGVEAPDKVAVIYLSRSEITTLARTAVDAQVNGFGLEVTDVVADATSASLDIAALGRMFANQATLGTVGAFAFSHAVTTHPMTLTSDYFSAVDDAITGKAAAHLGMAYYTSGVYYRTVTVDVDQLRRSWSAITADTALGDLKALLRASIEALPSGKKNATNAHTLPTTLVAETTRSRFAYDFDAPVQPGPDGGFKEASIARIAEARREASAWDSDAFLRPAYLLGETGGINGERCDDIDELVERVAEEILAGPAAREQQA